MQSGYGVSEIPQFLVDGLCSPLFPSTAPDQHPPPHHHHHHPSNTTATPPYHYYHYQQQQPQQQLQQFYHLQPQPPPPPQPHLDPPRFPNFHPIPITQQLFEQTHQFQLFDHQRRSLHTHLGLDHDSPPPPASASPGRIVGAPPFMNFRLAVNESSAGGGGGGASRDGLNDDDDGLLPGDEEGGCESRVNLWAPPPREEDAAIKEPFWRPLDIDYITRNSKRCKENESLEQSPQKHSKETKDIGVPESEEATNSATNYKLFSELEAICKSGAAAAPIATNNPTGSSSALTGENRLAPPAPNYPEFAQDHGSNASTGDEEGSLKNNPPKSSSTTSSKVRRRKKRKQQFSSIAAFFESLVKQLMDHQETLHRRFLDALENRDHERAKKEQQWQEQEAARTKQEVQDRAEQQAVAAAREAAIVSFLEKITGQPLNLPSRVQFDIDDNKQGNNTATEGSDENRAAMNSNRWPKAEVQALIKVRSGLESRFQEPGLKGPLWEEVSSIMGAMGYRRNAKRCKEKWENINKYFRKTKESNKKRPQHSKTCPYFHQLDQLYSKSQNNKTPMEVDRRGNSELLDAIVVQTDQIGSRSLDQNAKELNRSQGNERHEHGDDDDEYQDDEEDNDDEEGEDEEVEMQGTMHSSQQQHNEETQLSSHEHASRFFRTLQS